MTKKVAAVGRSRCLVFFYDAEHRSKRTLMELPRSHLPKRERSNI